MVEIVLLQNEEDHTRFEVGQVFYVAFVDRHKGTIGLEIDLEKIGLKLAKTKEKHIG